MSQRSCSGRQVKSHLSRQSKKASRNLSWKSLGLVEPLERRVLLSGSQPITLFTTIPDFTGWSVGASPPVNTVTGSATYDADGSTTNGVGNIGHVGASGSVGSLQIDTGSNGISFETAAYSPNEDANQAFMSAIDPGSTGGATVAYNGVLEVTYTAPSYAGPDTYFQLGVDLSYGADNSYQSFFDPGNNSSNSYTDTDIGTVDGVDTHTVIIPYSIKAGASNGSFQFAPVFNGGTFSPGIAGVNNVLTAPFYLDDVQVMPTFAPYFTSADSTAFTPGKAGSFAITAGGGPSATSLYLVGNLPAGVTFTSANNGTAVLKGTPAAGTAGAYDLTLIANNGVAPYGTQSFVLSVDQFTTANQASFTANVTNTFTATASGLGDSVTYAEIGNLPTGVTFNTSSGILAGTPTSIGTFALTLTATNGTDSTTQTFMLSVDESATISSANNTTFTAGKAGAFNVTTTGYPTAAIIFETGALPAGVSLVTTGTHTAELKGTPAATSGGTYHIVLDTTNGFGDLGTQNFTLVVDQAPIFTSAASATLLINTSPDVVFTTSGVGATTTYTETGTLPTGITFNAASNDLEGSPTVSGGPFKITIGATNGVGAKPTTQVFTFNIDAPATIGTAATTGTLTAGKAGTFAISSVGAFPAKVSFFTASPLPTGVSLIALSNTTAEFKGTPAAGTGGSYPVTVYATNGVGGLASQVFTLNVNQAPAITSAAAGTFVIDAASTFTVTTSGFPVTLSETPALPAGLSFHDNGNGTALIEGTPSSTAGTFVVTLSASNTLGSASQVFTVTVDQVAAVTSDDSTTFDVGTLATFSITTSGSPTATLTETGGLPSGLNFSANANGTGSLTGTPGAGTGGTYVLTLTAANSAGTTHQTFTLTVDQDVAFTGDDATTFDSGTAGTFLITTTGFPAVTVSEIGTPTDGITVTSADGVGTLTTTNSLSAGTYNLTLSASNSFSGATTETFTLILD